MLICLSQQFHFVQVYVDEIKQDSLDSNITLFKSASANNQMYYHVPLLTVGQVRVPVTAYRNGFVGRLSDKLTYIASRLYVTNHADLTIYSQRGKSAPRAKKSLKLPFTRILTLIYCKILLVV